MLFASILLISTFYKTVHSHSWVACTNYNSDVTSNTFDFTKCLGYPRDFSNFHGSGFGADTGYNYQPVTGSPACITNYSSNSYSSTYNTVTYQPGQQVRVVWPAKNHDVGDCTNPYIPDTTMQLYMDCSLGGSKNPTVDQFAVSSKLVIDWKANGKSGFQNCPFFCNSTDKAICYEDFTIPSTLQAGSTCTFMWYWVFNPDTTPYTSCWEATISGSSSSSGSGTSSTTVPSPTTSNTQAVTPSTSAPAASTPSPTSSSSGTCSGAYAQCGGVNYAGSTCCTTGYTCSYNNQYYSQCIPPTSSTTAATAATASPTTSPSTSAPKVSIPTSSPTNSSGTCSSSYAQCGGINFSGPTCCIAGYTCSFNTQYYSQCIPSTSQPTSATSSSCAAVYGQCGGSSWSGTTCCSSGNVCSYSDQYYSQCLPQSLNANSPATTSSQSNATSVSLAVGASVGALVLVSVGAFIIVRRRRRYVSTKKQSLYANLNGL